MSSIKTLSREAHESAKFRGHDMTRFKRINHKQWYSECKNCHKTMIINIDPMQNEIDIMGNAIALDCAEYM
jgi:hypothetical protein